MIEIPKWQVHRGYWLGGLRENTMQAFYAAKRLGAEMIEFDVRVSKDGVPVVFHDDSLQRIFHIDQKIAKMSWEDLSALNVTRLLDVIRNENVPKYLNVELKSESLMPFRLVKNVAKVLQSVKMKKYLVSSFNPACLMLAKMLMPGVPRALLLSGPSVVLGWQLSLWMRLSDPQLLHVDHKLLDSKNTRDAIIAAGLPIVVWTVNDLKKAAFFMERGAISVISDNPPPPHLRKGPNLL